MIVVSPLAKTLLRFVTAAFTIGVGVCVCKMIIFFG